MPPKSKSKAKAKGKSKPKLSAAEAEARNKILENFRSFDLNGDGLLQKGELKALLKVLDPTNWTDDAIDRLVQAFDGDGDGEISLEEFVDWVTGATDADHDAFAKAQESHAVERVNQKHAQEMLGLLKGFDVQKEAEKVSASDLEAVVRVASPSPVLHRCLALVYLLLQPSFSKATGRPVNFSQPTWAVIQHLLQDSSFLQRISVVDHRRKEMKNTHSLVAAYAVDNFLCVAEPGEEERPPPLSYEDLLAACQAHKLGKSGPVIVLFKWCLSLLDAKLHELARDKLREQATREFKEEEVRHNEIATKQATREFNNEIATVNAKTGEMMDELEDLLAAEG